MSNERSKDGPHLGAMLRLVWQWVRDEIHAEVVQAGYDDLSSAHLMAFRYPSPDGMRPSELAAGLQLSKQSVNDLVGHLEQHGYLVREPDPADGRARVLHLTARGRRLEQVVDDAARTAERRIAELLGAGRFTDLRDTLEELSRELGGAPQHGVSAPRRA